MEQTIIHTQTNESSSELYDAYRAPTSTVTSIRCLASTSSQWRNYASQFVPKIKQSTTIDSAITLWADYRAKGAFPQSAEDTRC